MGIAWLLLRRTFHTRPKRTLLFLFGYAMSTAVMITLLSVGEAVLQQARDKDLLGGGDVILVPQGIDVESIKVGGVNALYYSIPQSRFIIRQLLNSSRFEKEITGISPYLFSKLLYARKGEQIETIFAEGSIPDQEAQIKRLTLSWRNNDQDRGFLQPLTSELYPEMDHFHLPTVKSPQMDRWAEWHYFNFEGPDFYGYLSIMVAGDILSSKAKWIVSLQMVDSQYHRYAFEIPAKASDLPLEKLSYQVAGNQVEFVNDHYELTLDFSHQAPVSGKLLFYPAKGLYFPPAYLAKSDQIESGYVIPAIRGRYQGNIRIGSRNYNFDSVNGYHDHNWGIWQQTTWNWGHAFSNQFAIFFGEIFLDNKSKGLFACVFDNQGFLSVFRPQRLEFSDYRLQPEGIRVPMKFQMEQQKPFSSLQMTGNGASLIANPVGAKDSLYFIQYRTDYEFDLVVDGHHYRFPARGNAETYVLK